MAPRRVAGDHNPSDGGIPTPSARRARVATASAALVLAAGVTVVAVWGEPRGGLAALAGVAGIVLILGALLAAWHDGIVAAAAMLLAAYALSLADSATSLDWRAPLVAVVLLGVVEFGSWSLELQDGAEERPWARVSRLAVLLLAAAAASTLVLAVSSLRIDAGLALWALGAAAVICLLALIGRPSAR